MPYSQSVDRARRAVVAWLDRTPAYLGVAGALAVCAVIALGMAVVTDQQAHRIWGLLAAAGYLVAGVAALRTRRPIAGVRIAVAGSVLLPTLVLVVAGISQPEVGVVERSARLLVDTGSPYLAQPTTTYDVNPYLPLMSLFGIPRLVFPHIGLGDPRWWFLLVFCACFVAGRLPDAGRPARPRRPHREARRLRAHAARRPGAPRGARLPPAPDAGPGRRVPRPLVGLFRPLSLPRRSDRSLRCQRATRWIGCTDVVSAGRRGLVHEPQAPLLPGDPGTRLERRRGVLRELRHFE
ncbi:MAG: hypothetical protein J0I40_10345 [Cellulomonas sp.]|nr:hypothetical protein [Cellulomonas sp.]